MPYPCQQLDQAGLRAARWRLRADRSCAEGAGHLSGAWLPVAGGWRSVGLLNCFIRCYQNNVFRHVKLMGKQTVCVVPQFLNVQIMYLQGFPYVPIVHGEGHQV